MSRKRWIGLAVAGGVVLLLGANFFRPIAQVAASQTVANSIGGGSGSASIPWPGRGQGAIGVQGGAFAVSPGAQPQPIGSVAKVLTALVVLDAKPLSKGQDGPTITMGAEDVADYQQSEQNKESDIPVQLDEQLTEYQALQALLLPSANNIARTLAKWTAGSLPEFVKRMNARAAALGLRHSKFAEPAGISPQTISSPADLVRLGQAAMDNPVLADVVGQAEATLPLAGRVFNANGLVTHHGVVGIKTGNITEAGAVLLFAATHQLAGRQVLLFGVVMGLPTIQDAEDAATVLVDAMRSSLEVRHIVTRDDTVGRYEVPWGGGSDLAATEDLDVIVLRDTPVRVTLRAPAVTGGAPAQTLRASLHVAAGDAAADVPVTNTDTIGAPNPFWRLVRLF